MKKIASSIFLLPTIFLAISCMNPSGEERVASGIEEEKTFDVSEFDKIEYGSAFEAEILKGSSFKVVASGDETDIADLEVDVIGGVLTVNYSNGDLFSQISRSRMQLVIKTPATLRSLDLGGASKTKVGGFDLFEILSMDISGASKLNLDVAVKSLEIDISGASKVTLNQDIGTMEGDVSGASSLNANEKSVLEATLEVSGASSASLNVEDRLDVDVSGASTVRYSGDPKVSEETSGAGRVIKK